MRASTDSEKQVLLVQHARRPAPSVSSVRASSFDAICAWRFASMALPRASDRAASADRRAALVHDEYVRHARKLDAAHHSSVADPAARPVLRRLLGSFGARRSRGWLHRAHPGLQRAGRVARGELHGTAPPRARARLPLGHVRL